MVLVLSWRNLNCLTNIKSFLYCFCETLPSVTPLVKVLSKMFHLSPFQLIQFILKFSYPASILKLYIQDVDAALNILHQTRWYSLFIRNSQGFGRCRESFPGRSRPYFEHASFSVCLREVIRAVISFLTDSSTTLTFLVSILA